jgi:uncharacterized protein
MKLKRIQVPLEIRATGENGVVEGYGSVFGNEDSYGDIVAKGAFLESLAQHRAKGTMPAMLWQHNADWPVGKWTSISEDERGLKMTGVLNMKTTRGIEAYEHLKAGDISGLSIGFMTKSYEYDEEKSIRTLTAVDLWEVSLVTFPANEMARVMDTRSADEIGQMTEREIERYLRDAGLSRSCAGAVVHQLSAIQAQRDAATVKDAELKAALISLRSAVARTLK